MAAFGSLLALVLTGWANAGEPSRDRPTPHGFGQVFSPRSFWNRPLRRSAPIDPHSTAMVSGLVGEVNSELARDYGPWINTREYSVPVYTVGRRQRKVRVALDRDQPALQRAVDAVPIPARARPAAGSDRHMVILQPSTDRMWEFWRMRKLHGHWHAGAAGAMRHLSTNPGRFGPRAWPGAQRWWGATATGLPLLGGLMRVDELQRGRIDHALAMAIPHARAGVWAWPATHGDGDSSDPNSLPEGARLRLDPALDLKALNLPPLTRMMAEAAQRYGIVIRDRSGVVAFYGQDPTPTGKNPYPSIFRNRSPSELLAKFPWRGLRVLRLRLGKAQ